MKLRIIISLLIIFIQGYSSNGLNKTKMQYTKETEVFGGMTSEDQLLSNPTPDEENTQEKKDELFEKVMKALPLQNEKANEVIIRNQSNENHSPNKLEYNVEEIRKQIDSRYTIKKQMDEFMNKDKTVRFIATDGHGSFAIKIYLNGNPEERGKFIKRNEAFEGNIFDCNMNKEINSRLYNTQTSDMTELANNKDKNPIYPDLAFPFCVSPVTNKEDQTATLNAFTLPMGVSVAQKCLKEEMTDNSNSCIQHLRLVTRAIIEAISIMNSKAPYYKHGNITPENVYIVVSEGKVYLDNALYEMTQRTEPNDDYLEDLDNLGDTLISMITGSASKFFADAEREQQSSFNSPFELYLNIQRYLKLKGIKVNLDSPDTGIFDYMKPSIGKSVTQSEYNVRLQNSVFDLIFRLKSNNKESKFNSITEALEHPFIKEVPQSNQGGDDEKEYGNLHRADY